MDRGAPGGLISAHVIEMTTRGKGQLRRNSDPVIIMGTTGNLRPRGDYGQWIHH